MSVSKKNTIAVNGNGYLILQDMNSKSKVTGNNNIMIQGTNNSHINIG